MTKNLIKLVQKHISPLGHKFTIALSGGVDSVVLLHILSQLRATNAALELKAVHVNHGISQNAENWSRFCETLCTTWNIPFHSECVSLPASNRQGVEQVAREARYNALHQHKLHDSIILLGQHQDDQVETFFLRLKRGSGLTGLSAMQHVSVNGFGDTLVRPLLDASRANIEAYANEWGLSHIHDESNDQEKYDRNFLRLTAIPLLQQRFNSFNQCVARSCELLQQDKALLDEYTQLDLEKCCANSGLDLSRLEGYSTARQHNVLRAWLAKLGFTMPSYKQLMQLQAQAFGAKADANITIRLSSLTSIRRYQNTLYVVEDKPLPSDRELDRLSSQTLDHHFALTVINTEQGLSTPEQNDKITLRFNIGDVLFKPHNKPGRNKVNHWLKDKKIPPWQRPFCGGVFYNDVLVYVVNLGPAEGYLSENGLVVKVHEINED